MASIAYQGGCVRFLAVMTILVTSCSGHIEEEIEYTVYRHPIASYEDMNFLGVPIGKGFHAKQMDVLVKKLEACSHYTKVNRLDTSLKLHRGSSEEVAKGLNKNLVKFQDSRYVHGVLVLEILVNRKKSWKKPLALFSVNDSQDHQWLDSYGNAGDPANRLFSQEAISPKFSFNSRRVHMVGSRYDIKIRYVLYNKSKDQIILDKQTSIASSISYYSKKSAIDPQQITNLLFDQLYNRVVRDACPKIADVRRKLVAPDGEQKSIQLTQKGIEYAQEDNWAKAADQWKRAVLVDKSNAHALHNLGIYYERTGRIPSAMEEFWKAKAQKHQRQIPVQYDDSLKILRPQFNVEDLEPHVYTVSGANWVSVLGGSFKAGDLVSVYRSRRLTRPPKFEVQGVNLTEVGRIRITKWEPPFYLGRVSEFVEPFRIETGDLIFVDGKK